MNSIRNRLPLKVLIPVLIISIFAICSFAASVSVSTTNNAGQVGVLYLVNGYFTAASQGFQVVRSTTTASSQPATWTNGTTCNTALAQGDWYYQVKLDINANATITHTFTLTVQWNTGSGYTTLGSLQFTTPSTITATQDMYFQLDTGVTTFTAPAGITITVA
jgi:hypothetical protein